MTKVDPCRGEGGQQEEQQAGGPALHPGCSELRRFLVFAQSTAALAFDPSHGVGTEGTGPDLV